MGLHFRNVDFRKRLPPYINIIVIEYSDKFFSIEIEKCIN